jgi:hypothetical protein
VFGRSLAHELGEALDAVGVLAVLAELVAVDEPGGGAARAGGLDVGGLAACLPTAGDDEGVLDGGAAYGARVLPYLPQLPIEWAALACGTSLVARRPPRGAWDARARYGSRSPAR